MGVYKRPDSPFYWMALDGFYDARHNPLRESTGVRWDAPTPVLRREAQLRAQVKFHERMLELADGTGPGKKPRILLNDFLDWYEQHTLPGRRGAEREREILPRWRAAFGTRYVHTIDQQLVAEWMTTRATKVSPATVNREVDVLKAVLKAAVPKYLTASPLKGMSRYRQTTPKRRLMTPEEEARLLKVMAPDDKALFLLGLDSLVRLGDLLDLRKADDHGEYAWVADPKAGGGFNVPISARAREALDAHLKENNPELFLFKRRRVAKTERDRRNGIRQMLERYCKDANVPYGRKQGGLTFHWATRRTGATRMLTRGIDPGTVQKVGRWKRADVVLGIYHELLDERGRAAVEAVGPREPHVNGDRDKPPKPATTRNGQSAKNRPKRTKKVPK